MGNTVYSLFYLDHFLTITILKSTNITKEFTCRHFCRNLKFHHKLSRITTPSSITPIPYTKPPTQFCKYTNTPIKCQKNISEPNKKRTFKQPLWRCHRPHITFRLPQGLMIVICQNKFDI